MKTLTFVFLAAAPTLIAAMSLFRPPPPLPGQHLHQQWGILFHHFRPFQYFQPAPPQRRFTPPPFRPRPSFHYHDRMRHGHRNNGPHSHQSINRRQPPQQQQAPTHMQHRRGGPCVPRERIHYTQMSNFKFCQPQRRQPTPQKTNNNNRPTPVQPPKVDPFPTPDEDGMDFPVNPHQPGHHNPHTHTMDDLLQHIEDADQNMEAQKQRVATCPTAPNHSLQGKKPLLISSLSPDCPPMTWQDAVEFCQKANLQAYEFGRFKDRAEMEDVLKLLHERPQTALPIQSFWTSGKILEHADLSRQRPATLVEWPSQRGMPEHVSAGAGLWARKGRGGSAQPDNYARRVIGKNEDENCVVVQKLNGGLAGLHDTLCGQRHAVICEEVPSKRPVELERDMDIGVMDTIMMRKK